MINIFVKNVKSALSDYTEELEELLAVKHDGYFFSPQYKRGLWDGKTHFLTVPALKFPTGLLFIVEEYFKEKDMKYSIVDLRGGRVADASYLHDGKFLHGITLRDYQIEAINRGLIYGRGIFEVATGLGKTEIAAGIIKALGLRTLFMVHTQDLLRQTVSRLSERLETTIGCIGDKVYEAAPSIVVATVQSLFSLMKQDISRFKALMNSFKVMFQDETHHSSSMTFYRLAMFMHNAYYRFGLSGTPLKKNKLSNMKVMAVTGPVIYSKLAEEGIEEGFLSNIEIRIVDNTEEIFDAKWQQIYESGIVRSEHRNTLITEIVNENHKKHKRQMLLVRYIEHGKVLQRMLNNHYRIPTKFLSGRDPAWRREQIKGEFNIQDMKKGGFVLVASTIFDEGVDIPEVNVLIHAAGGKSEVKTIQKTGRGLRLKKDNEKLIVYDFNDQNSKFLSTHSKKRIKTYKQEGFLK